MKILGIETSCDETAAAVVESGKILSTFVATQHDVHERFGGVVPELASRRHMEDIVPLVRAALDGASIDIRGVDGVAATFAPGLVGSLLVGLSMAKAIAFIQDIPFIGVNHLDGHLNAVSLEFGELPYPYVGLVVSGGHTSLYLVKEFGRYELLGATRDDAAGEAFDKVAKLLELGYPGGPAIDKAARGGDRKAFRFSKTKFTSRVIEGQTARPYDFSFSGIKTAVLNIVRKNEKDGAIPEQMRMDIAASFEEAVAKTLVERLLDAAKEFGARSVVLAGGVAANRRLRELLASRAKECGISHFIPSTSLCTDNAAMIAYVGTRLLEAGLSSDLSLNAIANQEIGI